MDGVPTPDLVRPRQWPTARLASSDEQECASDERAAGEVGDRSVVAVS